MTLPKITPRSLTAIPRGRGESRNKKKSNYGNMTVPSQHPSLSTKCLPPITGNSLHGKGNIKSGECTELWKTYDGLLNKHLINEALIKEKDKQIEEQIQDMENLFSQAEEEQNVIEKAQQRHADTTKMLKDIEVENTRVKIRESEQALEVANLEESNKEKRRELRNLMDKITDVQNRIERGPDYIKEEIERFQRKVDELKWENKGLNFDVKHKSAELNDLRIELIMQDDGDSENEYDGEKMENCEIVKVSSPINTGCVTPPLILHEPKIEQNTPNALKLDLGDLNEHVPLPQIRQRDAHENKPKPYKKPLALNANPVLPAIDGVRINNQPNNPSESSRTTLHRGTSTANTTFIPNPPTSGLPALPQRRRKIKRH